jgi:mono/diheme cytochrome c family protein
MKKVNIAILLLAGMAFPSITPDAQAQDLAAGKAAYTKRCQTCHAADGKGSPAMAKALKIEFRALGSPEVLKKTDADLKKVITEGMGKMKGVTGITAAEMNDIVAFMRSLKM